MSKKLLFCSFFCFFSNFQRDGSVAEKFCVRIGSALSTIGLGLNLPNHLFMMISANIYKPSSTRWQYKFFSAVDTKFYQSMQAIIQSAGRICRLTKDEEVLYDLTGKSNAKRILFFVEKNNK